MNKTLLLICLALSIVFAGCSTGPAPHKSPYFASTTFPPVGTYKILGRVFLSNGDGYMALLKHAKSVYPTTGDVVNIIVDQETTFYSGYGMTSNTYVTSYNFSGIAIEYLK